MSTDPKTCQTTPPYAPLQPTVALNTPIDVAISLARLGRRSTLFVVELGTNDAKYLLGEVKLGDLLQQWLAGVDCVTMCVREWVQPIAYTISVEELANTPRILELFDTHKCEHLPVMNPAHECMGLLIRDQYFDWLMHRFIPQSLTQQEFEAGLKSLDTVKGLISDQKAEEKLPANETSAADAEIDDSNDYSTNINLSQYSSSLATPDRQNPDPDADTTFTTSAEEVTDSNNAEIQRLHADIEDYKLLEGKLYSSYMQMQSLFDVMRDVTAIVAVTEDGFDVNIPSATLFEDPIGAAVVEQVLEAFLAAPDPNDFQSSVRRALEQNSTIEREHQFLIGGQTLYFEALVSPISGTSVLWMARNITALKRVEQALKVSQERFRYLLTSNPAVVYTCKIKNHAWKTFVGDNIFDLLGDEAAHWVAQPEVWRSRLHPEDVNAVAETLTRLAEQGHCVMEYRVLHQNGSYRWLRDELKVAIDPASGQPFEGIGSLVDISDRKRAEAGVLQALEKERELNDLKSRFVSMASHEFRTPLAIIQSSAQLLERYELDDAEKQEQFEQINSSTAHMNQLLKDVLTLGKAEAGTIDFNPEPLPIRMFCQLLVSQLQTAIARRHRIVMIVDETIDDTTTASLDAKLVRQVLTNLISNAIKYSPEADRVEFHVTLYKSEPLSQTQPPPQVQFSVTDYGIGIPPSELPRLCESFHRAANVGTIQGTGLGLAIVQRCVSLHGGTIDFDSRIEYGTTVTIRLPQASPPPSVSTVSNSVS